MWKSARSRVLATMAFSQPATIFGKKLSNGSDRSLASAASAASNRGPVAIRGWFLFFVIFFHLRSLNCSVPTVHCTGIREASGEAFAPIPEDKMQRETEREVAEAEPNARPLKPAIKKGKETKAIKEVRTERGKLGKTKPRLKFEGHEEDAMDVPAECDLPFKLWSVVQS